MKKIRVTVPYSMAENLENDREEFEIEKLGTLGNKILNYYIGKEIKVFDLKGERGEIIQFNLTKINEELFNDGLIKTQKDNGLTFEHQLADAEYVRNIFFNYFNNPKAKRERIAFNTVVNEIEEAILKDNKIKIKYSGEKEPRLVSPYHIVDGDRENRIYLLCWCEKNKDYRSYRIAKINSTIKSFERRGGKNIEFIENLRKNFDPFRTYGSEVIARLTPQGEKILKSAITNRPKQLNIEEIDVANERDKKNANRIYKFQCNEALGKVYFPQFLNEVEILEPESLREWFKKKFEDGSRLYDTN